MTISEHERDMGAWHRALDGLILGISHYMSNRVSTLAGVSDLLAIAPSDPAPLLGTLADEVVKLEEAIRLFRMLSATGDDEELVEPARIVRDAAALAGMHRDLSGVEYALESAGEIPPVVAHPTALTHTILVAMAEAAGRHQGEPIPIKLSSDGDDVVIQVANCDIVAPTLFSARRGAQAL